MNLAALRTLTWATVTAAIVSALLMAALGSGSAERAPSVVQSANASAQQRSAAPLHPASAEIAQHASPMPH